MSTEERVLRLENAFTTLVELARNQEERMDDFNEHITALAEVQARTEANLSALTTIVSEMGQKVEAIADDVATLTIAQARTDERLTSFIATVERYIERRNGG